MKVRRLRFIESEKCINYWDVADLGSYFTKANPRVKTLHLQQILAQAPLKEFLNILTPILDVNRPLPVYDPKALARGKAEQLAARESRVHTSSNPPSSGASVIEDHDSEQSFNFLAGPSTCGKTGDKKTLGSRKLASYPKSLRWLRP